MGTRQSDSSPVAESGSPPRGRSPARFAFTILLWAVLAPSTWLGCEPQRPWDGPLDGAVQDESRPWLPHGTDASWLRDGGPVDGGASPDGGRALSPSAVGGLWVSCYGGFHPSGHPLRDVTRLGLLCGPPNGMKLLTTEAFQGEVAEGQQPVLHHFDARRGECYRVFAVAEPGVTDLDILVRSSRGSRLAKDHSEDAWPIVAPDRPFCTFDDDRFTVALRARRGSGRYAAQVWKLE